MRNFLGLTMIFLVYIIVYYRLLVRHDYETTQDRKETAFGAIFSFPPYKLLSNKGKQYAKKYWIALSVIIACVSYLAISTNYQVMQ